MEKIKVEYGWIPREIKITEEEARKIIDASEEFLNAILEKQLFSFAIQAEVGELKIQVGVSITPKEKVH